MIAHATLAVNNYATAKEFYRKALAPLGYEFTDDHPDWNADGNNVEAVWFDYSKVEAGK